MDARMDTGEGDVRVTVVLIATRKPARRHQEGASTAASTTSITVPCALYNAVEIVKAVFVMSPGTAHKVAIGVIITTDVNSPVTM